MNTRETLAGGVPIAEKARWRERLSRRFFVAMSLFLLTIVVVGFARTLFFRPFFDPPSIPAYLVVHGVVVSAWYAWFFVQSSLVVLGRTEVHRRLGVVGVAIATGVVVVGSMATLNFIPRVRATGAFVEEEAIRLVAVTVGNPLVLLVFVTLVALAIAYRRRPEIHKRLMLFASISIIGPAGSRLPATLDALGINPSVADLLLVVLLVAPIAYDLLARGRPHVVTILCLPAVIAPPVLSGAIAANESVQAFVLGLR